MKRQVIKIDSSKAKQILSRAKINEDLLEFEEIYSGWNTIYLLKTDKKVYSLRFFTTDFGYHGNEWKAEKEKYVLECLTRKNVKVPKFFYIETSRKFFPSDFILIEYLPGIQLSEIDGAVRKNRRRSKEFPKEDYASILYEIGKQMALIHSTKMPKLSIFDFPLQKGSEWKPLKTFDQYLKRCPDKKLKQQIRKYAGQVLNNLPKKPRLVPVHTEITSRNVLVTKNKRWKLSGILDVEWFMKCLPEREFARPTYELLAFHRSKNLFRWRLEKLLRGYYDHGGVLDFPETIPLMILHHLLWMSYTPKRAKENIKLLQINLKTADKIIKEYKKIIHKITQ